MEGEAFLDSLLSSRDNEEESSGEPEGLGSSQGELPGKSGKKRLFPRSEEGLVLEDPHWQEMCAVLRGPLGEPVNMVLVVHAVLVGLLLLALTSSKCTE